MIRVRCLYLKTDNAGALYYPNNIYKIYETYPLSRAIEILCDVGCLILPDPILFQETHPHNTVPNIGVMPLYKEHV